MRYQRLVGFGEAMLRLTTLPGESLDTATELRTSVGGAELNGLIAGTRSGMPSVWVSALPDSPLGRLVLRHARSNGVDAVTVAADGSQPARLGLYFLEMAPPPRPLRIIYDRAGSAFTALDPEGIAWDELLDEQTCLYLSGITPPLGSEPRKAMDAAMRTAREVGATVALDVNYRSALWSRREAGQWLASALPEIDILSASAFDLAAAGVEGDDAVAETVRRFGLQAAITTTKRRVDVAEEIQARAVTPEGEQRAAARAVIMDPVGAGDALFGTFLAKLPATDLAAATESALGAAVTSCGLFGDALVTDPWDPHDPRGVIR